MPVADFFQLVLIALVAALAVAALGAVVLVAVRRAAFRLQLGILVATAVAAVVVAMVAVAKAMFLSQHDLSVAIAVACVAGTVSLVFGLSLGTLVSRNFRALLLATRGLATGIVPPPITAMTAETRELAQELRLTHARLDESHERELKLEDARRKLIAGISHDLRTPLAGIRAMSEALEDGIAADETRYLREIRGKVEQLSGLVDDLFELSKIDAGLLSLRTRDISLYDIVSDTVAELGPAASDHFIRIEALDNDALNVRADPRELSRAISNLLLNAVQHTPAGTPITVLAGRSDDGRPLISVIDEGGGISEDDLARVFEPGWRGADARSPLNGGRTAGAGLGLAIVAGILSAHKGEATVRNVPGGCRFDLLLPA
jgi:signal transduction histidine kinase